MKTIEQRSSSVRDALFTAALCVASSSDSYQLYHQCRQHQREWHLSDTYTRLVRAVSARQRRQRVTFAASLDRWASLFMACMLCSSSLCLRISASRLSSRPWNVRLSSWSGEREEKAKRAEDMRLYYSMSAFMTNCYERC